MAMPLTPNDFPLYCIGALVYKRSESSPLFQASDDALAANICFRLNSHEAAKSSISIWPSELTIVNPAPHAAQPAVPTGKHYIINR